MADGSVRIHLATPIALHGEARFALTLRPFTYGERIEHGDPLEFVTRHERADDPEGPDAVTTIRVIDRAALIGWMRRLLADHDLDVLWRERSPQAGMLADMMEDAILGFFRKARSWSSPKPAPSSEQASPSPTSPA